MKYCVLITDLSHFVAQATAVELLKRGYRVIGLTDQKTFIEPLQQLIANHVDDISNLRITNLENSLLETKTSILKHCDIVFHMLAPPPILDEDGRLRWIHTLHHETIQWLESSKKAHIQKFTVTSSILSLRYNMKTSTMNLVDGQSFCEPQWDTLTPFSTQIVKSDIANWEYVTANKLENIFTAIYVPTVFGHFKGFSTTPFIRLMQKMADGQFMLLPKLQWPGIDIIDVVQAHMNIIHNNLLTNKRLVLADETISISTVKDLMVSIEPSLKKNMPRITPPVLFEPLIKQFIPQYRAIMEELNGKIIANSKFTRELLQTSFIPSEEALIKTLKDIIN